MVKKIVIKGAKEHNLKNISLEIPKDKFIVITGLSGSGKSSLAFDTIYAEGQRRYVESLSAYARQFLDKMKKPNVDLIEGLSPAISIEQKNAPKNPPKIPITNQGNLALYYFEIESSSSTNFSIDSKYVNIIARVVASYLKLSLS